MYLIAVISINLLAGKRVQILTKGQTVDCRILRPNDYIDIYNFQVEIYEKDQFRIQWTNYQRNVYDGLGTKQFSPSWTAEEQKTLIAYI